MQKTAWIRYKINRSQIQAAQSVLSTDLVGSAKHVIFHHESMGLLMGDCKYFAGPNITCLKSGVFVAAAANWL